MSWFTRVTPTRIWAISNSSLNMPGRLRPGPREFRRAGRVRRGVDEPASLLMRVELTFPSGGTPCAAWHYPGRSGLCVVMAHGLGGTRRSGLEPAAERLAAAGHQVLAFDYRCLGDSGGSPRQVASVKGQLADWQAAVTFARSLPGVRELALWGASYGAGHALVTAARVRPRALILQCPMADGRATVMHALRRGSPRHLLELALRVARDLLGGRRVMLAIVGPPGSLAFLNTPDAEPGYRSLAPPDWRNELSAGFALDTFFYRPIRHAEEVHCPTLVQICSLDTLAPPEAARQAARRLRGETRVLEYGVGHFDLFRLARGLQDQVDFLAELPCPPGS